MEDDDEDYYAPWEWQPLGYMPHGCNEVIIKFVDGSTEDMCSCDYWWGKDSFVQSAYSFRYK